MGRTCRTCHLPADRISELPAEILDNILGFLPIVEAARTAVLSTVWRPVWSSLTQLNFDDRFFAYIEKKYSFHRQAAALYVINKVLMQHNGPIRKFVFDIQDDTIITARSEFDFDQWLLLVAQKGVEEIYISFGLYDEYRLPNCIFSCPTLKRLHLSGVCVQLINAPCILPNVTSLRFEKVHFEGLQDRAAEIPMLENMSFSQCETIFCFNITAPKLGSLTIKSCYFGWDEANFLPVNLDLRSICTLDLDCSSLEDFVEEFTRMGGLQAPALNVEYLKLSRFPDDDMSHAFIDLLRICPKLCKLDISFKFDAVGSISKLYQELHSVARRHKMLHTLKLSSFIGSRFEMRFIKVLLACFPALEKVVIIRHKKFNSNSEFEIMRRLLSFPRDSKKAEILYF